MGYLIVGDTILDETIKLSAIGLSLESPTFKTKFISSSISFGGAANVAKNLSKLGKEVSFLTSISENNSKKFRDEFPKIDLINIFQGKDNVKSRYWVSHGDASYKYLQVNNINDENIKDDKFNVIKLDLNKFEVIAFADYRCGLIEDNFVEKCLNSNAKTFASSQVSGRKSNYKKYLKADYIVCNKKESENFSRRNNVCITEGGKGCTLNKKIYKTKTLTNATQTIGAGDVFYAAFLASEDPDFSNLKAFNFLKNIN